MITKSLLWTALRPLEEPGSARGARKTMGGLLHGPNVHEDGDISNGPWHELHAHLDTGVFRA